MDDALVDGNQPYAVNLSAASGDLAYQGLSGSVAVVNDDNDVAALTLGAISSHTSEAGASATFTVRLATQPTANVTVSLANPTTANMAYTNGTSLGSVFAEDANLQFFEGIGKSYPFGTSTYTRMA